MREKLSAIICASFVIVGTLLYFGAPDTTRSSALIDASWPNCTIDQTFHYQYGIIGVNDGLDFSSNPCLNHESTWFSYYALYLNTGYPGTQYAKKFLSSPLKCTILEARCLAYNWGYNAALYSLKYAADSNVHTSLWWLDVETDNSWSANATINRSSLQGEIDAIQRTTIFTTVGFYSTPDQWNTITDSWLNRFPIWLGTGSTHKAVAVMACYDSVFSGKTPWLAQYTSGLDHNISCSSRFIDALTFSKP